MLVILSIFCGALRAEGQQVDAVTNGTFQNGSSSWSTSGAFAASSDFPNCHSCPGYAYFSLSNGSGGNNLSGAISQTVSIPSGASSPLLTFWYRITTSETGGLHDFMTVSVTDTANGSSENVHTFSNQDVSGSYASYSFNLNAYIGKTFTVQFLGTTDGSLPTIFRVDDVSATYMQPIGQVPSTPTGFAATGLFSDVHLSWSDVTHETAYELQRGPLGGAFSTFTGSLAADTTSFTDFVGNYGIINCYRVRATNSSGASPYSSSACAATLAPPALTFPDDGASLTDSSVTLMWQAASAANGYVLNVGRSCGNTDYVNSVSTNQTSYAISVSTGNRYYWQVRAKNTTYPGNSDFTPCRSFTITSIEHPPASNFSWSPDPAVVDQTTAFTDLSTGATSWGWTFGDGATSSLRNPTHVFASSGNYDVILTASNAAGSRSTTKAVTVIRPPRAGFSYSPTLPTIGQSISFTDTSSFSPSSWQWSFGDGATSTAQHPTHSFGAAGQFGVTLTATNAAGTDTIPKTLTVSATPVLPQASFSYAPSAPKVGDSVTFYDQSSGSPTAWLWAFGDGATSSLSSPTHAFSAAGNYTVSLRVTNTAGSDNTTHTVAVTPAGTSPTAHFAYSPTSPKAGETVTFTDSSTNAPTTWLWSFGDGSQATIASPTHSFTASGTYTVSLTASNAFGANTETQSLVVGNSFAADFTWTPATPTPFTTVVFTDRTTGNPGSWSWNFGDNSALSSLQNPSHQFPAPGVYHVSLTALNAGGAPTSASRDITVVAPAAADFNWAPVYPTPATDVTFADHSAGQPQAWNWYFDDGASSTVQNPTHRFPGTGGYQVRLTVTMADNQSTVTHVVTVGLPPKPAISFTPNSPHPGETISFTGSAASLPDAWSWDFDDGSSSVAQNPTHQYNQAGDYSVRLRAQNRFGTDSTSVPLSIKSIPDACLHCVHLRGLVTIGSVPVTPSEGRVVSLVGSKAYAASLAADGSYELAAAQGSYDLRLTLSYPDTISASGQRRVTVSTPLQLSSDSRQDISVPPPVVFVQGIRSQPSRWQAWADKLQGSAAPVVLAVTYGDQDTYLAEAATTAAQIRAFFALLTGGLPSLRIIAHSKGGLVTRVLKATQLDIGGRIIDIIELGTPNRGTTCYLQGVAESKVRSYFLAADQVASLAPLGNFPGAARLHLIAGTANLLSLSYLDLIASPCQDGCDANDGLVSVSDVFSIPGASGFVVPYHHVDLGTDQTLWILSDLIVPYYSGAPFPTCGNGLGTDCGLPSCISGRGYTRSNSCSAVRPLSEHLNDVNWARAETLGGFGCSLLGASGITSCVIATPRNGSAICQNNLPAVEGIVQYDHQVIGYYVYRSATPDFSTAVRVAFVVGLTYTDVAIPSGITYYFVQEVRTGGSVLPPWRSGPISGGHARAAPHSY